MGGSDLHEFELCSGLVPKIFLQLLAGCLVWRGRVPCCGEPHRFLVCHWSHSLLCFNHGRQMGYSYSGRVVDALEA